MVYIIENVFMTFIICKFLHLFYPECKYNRWCEYAAFTGYFLSDTAVYLFLQIPIVNLLVNVSAMFLLTLLYEGTWKKSVLAVSSIYVTFMLAESAVAMFTGSLETNFLTPYPYTSVLGLSFSRIAAYIVLLAAQGFRNLRNNVPIPKTYWISLLAVPASTMSMLFILFMNPGIPRFGMILCVICAMVVNAFTFYLYDSLAALLEDRMKHNLQEAENRYYEQQAEMMRDTLNEIQLVRHDLKNELIPIFRLAQEEKPDEIIRQLQGMITLCDEAGMQVQTGNDALDQILNYKLNQAKKEGITVTTQITVPAGLNLKPYDCAAVFGNLLDNAIEAAKTSENRRIRLKLKYEKGCLLFEVVNTYDGIINQRKDKIMTRNPDQNHHGFGIRSVRNTLEKYHGELRISYDNMLFTASGMLYTIE